MAAGEKPPPCLQGYAVYKEHQAIFDNLVSKMVLKKHGKK